MNINPKTLPRPTPETRHFWEGARRGELLLQQCEGCTHVYFPPRPFCPGCASREIRVIRASGRATLYSYVINHRLPKWIEAPYAIAVVELEEGPRMMTNIVDTPQTPEALVLDMPLEVVFEPITADVSLPKFRPARGGAR